MFQDANLYQMHAAVWEGSLACPLQAGGGITSMSIISSVWLKLKMHKEGKYCLKIELHLVKVRIERRYKKINLVLI